MIDHRNERFEDRARDVDLVFDLIRGETQNRSWAVLKPGGTLVSTVADPDPAKARAHGARETRYMAEPNAAELREIAGLIDRGPSSSSATSSFQRCGTCKSAVQPLG